MTGNVKPSKGVQPLPPDAILDPAKFPADANYCLRGIEEVGLPVGSFYYVAKFKLTDLGDHIPNSQVRSYTSDTHVEEMVVSHRKGIGFPPILLRRIGPNSYSCPDGIHRVAAYAKTGTQTFPAIVVDAPDTLVVALAALMNGYNGMPNNDDDRLSVGMFMHQMPSGLSLDASARYARVTKTRLADYIKRADGADRAGRLGGTVQWNSLDATAQALLAGVKNREAFKEAVVLAARAKMDTDEVKGFVRELVKLADVELQKECIAKYRQDWENTALLPSAGAAKPQGTPGNPAQVRAHKAFGQARRMLNTSAFEGIFTSQEERQAAQEALVGLREDINKALAKLRKP